MMVIFWSGIRLFCGNQRVADLMVRDDLLLLIREDRVLLLVAGNDHFDALLQIGLGGKAAAITHRTQSSLIDNIGKLCPGGTGGHARHLQEVHIVGDLDLFRVNLQNGFAALEVGPLRSGSSTGTRRSKRPGRVRAGSSDSGRLVAARMITPLLPSKPSISVSS